MQLKLFKKEAMIPHTQFKKQHTQGVLQDVDRVPSILNVFSRAPQHICIRLLYNPP